MPAAGNHPSRQQEAGQASLSPAGKCANPVAALLALALTSEPRRAAKGLDLATRDDAARFAALRRSLEEPVRVRLYTPEFAARVDGAALTYLEQTYRQVGAGDLLQAVALTDITTYLPEDLLVRRSTARPMAHALEARSPFLDSAVVQLALTLPPRLKRDGNGSKRIIKKLFGPLFPPGFLERPKMSFSLPVDEWLRNELRGRLEARLFRGALVDANIVEPDAVWHLLFEHEAGRFARRDAVAPPRPGPALARHNRVGRTAPAGQGREGSGLRFLFTSELGTRAGCVGCTDRVNPGSADQILHSALARHAARITLRKRRRRAGLPLLHLRGSFVVVDLRDFPG